MICSKSRIDAEIKKITDIFLRNGYPDNIISSNIRSTISKFNSIKSFGLSKHPVYVKLSWFGVVSRFLADIISGSIMRCFKSVKVRTIFTARPAFQYSQKNLSPILQQSMMAYKFQRQCNADNKGRTIKSLEVRLKQRVPRE